MASTSHKRTSGLRSQQKFIRHRNIVRAAERLFSRKGYETTAMEDVARAAGLAVGTIYNYFPSKTDLLLAIVRRETDELYSRGERIAAEPPAEPAAAITAFCDVMVDGFLSDDRRLLRELLAAALNSPDTIGTRLFDADLRLVSLLVALLEKVKSRGALAANLDSVRAGGVLYAICMMWITAYLISEAVSIEQVRDEVHRGIEIAVFGMIAQPGAPQAGAPTAGEKS
jgi:AcrR family transcriptional regulator